MINKLKKRFIVLAMVSLAVLLAVIVAGMNIINYEKVVSDADTRIEVLEENLGSLVDPKGWMGIIGGPLEERDDLDDWFDDDWLDDDDYDYEGPYFGRRGSRGPSMSRDEAEESRFFTVVTTEDRSVEYINTERISSISVIDAEKYTKKALASGKDKGFIDEFRYSVEKENGVISIMFLDCSRVMESFRDFLKASILMSLIGLLIVFAVICYFAGRIVRPVAESYEKQKRFITDAGHEIKTPLAIMKANIDLMDMELDKKRVDRAELRENLGDINDQVDRLTGLTNDLVYLSRMEEAESSIVMTDVPLSDIVTETAESFRPLAEEQGKVIETGIESMISVQGSTKELEKLLSIILENAVKYSPAPDAEGNAPPIKLSLKKEGRNAVLEVRNETESELTNESLSHVFERFYRTDSSRSSQTGGHGIGLSVANAIVNAHGGNITAHTQTGRDFIVTASIPLS